MATSFTKQEQVMFDKVIDGFEDLLVIAKGADLTQLTELHIFQALCIFT